MGNDLSRSAFATRVLPFLRWMPRLGRAGLRADVEAGLVGAVLVLPQAIALAALAGMPPAYGIYTSILPVIIAALWGSSPQAVSGPNTAICVMLALAVAPLATTGSSHYISLVLTLGLMAGCVQLLLGLLRLGSLLDFISATVVSAIVHAVGLIMIVAALPTLLGTASDPAQPFAGRVQQFVQALPDVDGAALLVGLVTVATGLAARALWRRYALVLALASGSLAAFVFGLVVGEPDRVAVVGPLSLSWLPLSAPLPAYQDLRLLPGLAGSALSIAILGLVQTTVIARDLAAREDRQTDASQDMVAQGLANATGAFFSCFPGSGSFNRSMANFEAGARTPMAAVYASLVLALLVFAGAGLLAHLALPAVAGVLVLVSLGLIEPAKVRRIFRTRGEAFVFLATLGVCLGLGLNAGVATGILLSLALYLWSASTPNVALAETVARDGRPVLTVTIDGNLFFGSVQHVQRILATLKPADDEAHLLLLRTDHLTYLDVPGAELIAAEARRRRQAGSDLYLYITRDSVYDTLARAGVVEEIDAAHLLWRDRDHPLKELLVPPGSRLPADRQQPERGTTMNTHAIDIEALVQRLRVTRLIGPLSRDQLRRLLENTPLKHAGAGDIVIRQDELVRDHILLVQGELESQRTWCTPEGVERSFTSQLKPGDMAGAFVYISAASRNTRVRALTDVSFLAINADAVDELLGWSEQLAQTGEMDEAVRQRMNLVKQVSVFQQLPFENVQQAFARMREVEVEAGQTVVTQGDKGDCYYLIESGDADVMSTDPFTDKTERVARLGPGDGFGEESLLQGGYRNATVTMTTPGRLLALDKPDFDQLVKCGMVEEVSSEQARDMLARGEARLVDCRYDMEFEDSRIPGAIFLPLNRARWDVHELEAEGKYIVYCRSGRRSKAAAFLLRERNIRAVSLSGGIKEWPYEVDVAPVNVATDCPGTATGNARCDGDDVAPASP